MKRMVDKPYFTGSVAYALSAELDVKCPKCQGFGVVTAKKDTFFFRCTNCGHTQEKERTVYHYAIQNQCKGCGRYYRTEIKDKEKQHFPMLQAACPFCGTVMSGRVQKTTKGFLYVSGEIRNGYEPFFGLELWFLSTFQGKPVWALNREHLAYLIDYLSADLREKPVGYGLRTQSDHLPTFMKTAKNRERIVRLLKNMQEK